MIINKNVEFVTIIVTYGGIDRFDGVKSAIKSVIAEGTEKIFLIDNGCTYPLENKISREIGDARVNITRLRHNTGSAVGFSTGISEVLKETKIKNDTFVLILDDDVMLENNFVSNYMIEEENNPYIQPHIWSLYRAGRDNTFLQNYDRNKNYYLNSIAGFSIFKREYKNSRINNISRPFFIPWAGTFVKKDDLKNIILPNKELFVYEDDAEFSLNTIDAGFTILRSQRLVLEESSRSWFEEENQQLSGYKLFYRTDDNYGRFLYKIRNNIYLIKNRLVTNKLYFYLNIIVFILAGYIRYGSLNRHGVSRFKMLCSAVNDGLKGSLGENKKWKL